MKRSLMGLLWVLQACGGGNEVAPGPDAGGSPPDAAPEVPDAGSPDAPPGCNPLVGDDCLTPYPSSFQEVADPGTRTGFRVNLREEFLPVTNRDIGLDPVRLNQKDGFSPATPFLVYFKDGVDATQLPSQHDLAASILPTSTVQIVDYLTGERVPLFAELDANTAPPDRQVMLIHPMVRLKPATRYIVALVGLNDRAGAPLLPAPFRALRDQTALPPALAPLAERYEEIFTALAAAGLARGSLSLAWDVVTASDESLTGHLVAMRDTALAMADSGALGYGIAGSSETPEDPYILREIDATVQVPSYLESDEPNAKMHFGADGEPAVRGVGTAPVTILVPQCATSAALPLPFVVFGHGLFGNAKDTLADSRLREASQELCMIFIGTDWIGLSSNDLPAIANDVVSDQNNIYMITDRLQQAHVNVQVMTRLFRTAIKDDPLLAWNDQPISDGKVAYYLGISNGGVQGATFMALSPDITRGVLNVPGAEWSLMIYRSADFNFATGLFNVVFPDPLDRQALVALSQAEWDYSDPITFGPHLLHDPLPGSPVKQILMQESVGDAQVPNLATRTMARTMGISALELVEPVYGIEELPGPLASAYTQWNIHPMPLPPEGNTPLDEDNGAHGGIQALGELREQIRAFLAPDGQVIQTCSGPCDFPPAGG